MSLVDLHDIGMLSSVMRALKHVQVHESRGQRPSWRSSAAAVGSAGPFSRAHTCPHFLCQVDKREASLSRGESIRG